MGSKGSDPFGDIMQGVLGKQSMAEQKKANLATSKPPATPLKPVGTGALVNGVPATPPLSVGTPQVAVRPSLARGMASGSPSSSNVSLARLDDPFAGLGGLSKPPPMAASKPATPAARSPTPPHDRPASVQPVGMSSGPPTPLSSSPAVHAAAFDLDDMFGPLNSSHATQQTPKPAAAAAAVDHDDPFAAFDTVEGAAAAVPAAPVPQPVPAPASASPATSTTAGFPAATAAASSRPAAAAVEATAAVSRHESSEAPPYLQQPKISSNTPAAGSGTGIRPASTYFAQQEQELQQQQRHSSSTPADAPGSFSSIAAEQRFAAIAGQSTYTQYGSGDLVSYGSYSGSGASSSGKGWGGLLKNVTKTAAALGKKGLKAAQAGLQQLESALENIDRPAASGSAYGGGGGGSVSGQSYVADDLPAERVLSIAIHISEMASNRQEEALARLPPPVRQKVMALLREQAVIEGEEHLQASGSAGTFAPTSNGNSRSAAAGGGAGDAPVIQTREFDVNSEEQGQQPNARPAAGRTSPAAPAAAAATAPAAGSRAQSPSPAAAAAAAAAPVAAAAVQVVEDDLLGMHAAAAAPTAAGADRLGDVADIDDFFSGGATGSNSGSRASQQQQRPRSAHASVGNSSMGRGLSGSDGQLADLLGGGGAGAAAAGVASSASRAVPAKSSSMINLGGLEALHVDVDVTGHGDLYDDLGTDGDEPELRRQLRAARAAEKHAKMKAALAEKLAKEAEEQERRQQQQAHKQAHRERIEAWKNKNKGNVRGLLGSLQTVLWEDSGWKPIGMGDLLEPAQVRKAWMKANLLVHPDKVRQRNGSDEQVAIADMIFDALKEAWGQFKN